MYRNTKGRFRTPTPAEKGINVRSKDDAKKLDAMFKNGNVTFVLIYADWCGHCHRYLPTWDQLENTPGRTANMARVHYDMQENISAIKDAKIQGYPSVIKVLPDGRIQSYAAEGGSTNAIPHMREEGEMQAELQGKDPLGELTFPLAPSSRYTNASNSSNTSNTNQAGGQRQTGGSILTAFTTAIQKAGPAALLLLASSAISRRARTYRTPKRTSRRASTRRSRRF